MLWALIFEEKRPKIFEFETLIKFFWILDLIDNTFYTQNVVTPLLIQFKNL